MTLTTDMRGPDELPRKAQSAQELFSRVYPDCEVIRFGNFFFQAEIAHVVMLHSKAMKAGFAVNGRKKFSPFTFMPPSPVSHLIEDKS